MSRIYYAIYSFCRTLQVGCSSSAYVQGEPWTRLVQDGTQALHMNIVSFPGSPLHPDKSKGGRRPISPSFIFHQGCREEPGNKASVNILYSRKIRQGIKIGSLAVRVETAKLKSANAVLRNDIVHAVALLTLPGTPLSKLYI